LFARVKHTDTHRETRLTCVAMQATNVARAERRDYKELTWTAAAAVVESTWVAADADRKHATLDSRRCWRLSVCPSVPPLVDVPR